MAGFLHVRVVDQVVAQAFPQFVFPCGQGPLVAAHTEKQMEDRTICRQVRLTDRSTDQKIQCPNRRDILRSSQSIPGFFGEIGNDAFLHARTERVTSSLFPYSHLHVSGESVDNLCLIEQSAIKGSTGVWRLLETWRAWFSARFQNRTNCGRD